MAPVVALSGTMASIWASPRLAGDVAGGGPVQPVIREQAQFTRAGRDSGHWLEAVCHLVELLAVQLVVGS